MEIRVLLTKLWALKMERRPISVSLCKIKIKDIRTVIFFTRPIKVCHIEIRVHLTKLLAFKDGKKAHFSKPSQH